MKKIGKACALIVALACAATCFLAGCDNHEHTFSDEWTGDGEYHWHEATCGCNVTSEKIKHTLVVDEGYPADCYNSGLTDGSHCEVCDRVIEEQYTIWSDGHPYETTWSHDDEKHWHEVTCEHTGERMFEAAHNWNSGTVTVEPSCTTPGKRTVTCKDCELTAEHTIDNTGEMHSDWDNNVCGKCGFDMGGSKGLQWSLGGGKATLRGIGTCKDTKVVIPEYYNGYKVTKISADFNSAQMTSIVIPASMEEIDYHNIWYYGTNSINIRNRSLCEIYLLGSDDKYSLGNLTRSMEGEICNVDGSVTHSETLCDNGVVNVFRSLEEESRIKTVGDFIFCQSAKDDKWWLVSYTGKDADVVLPDSIEGNKYSIRQFALDMSGVRSLKLSAGVEYGERWAFVNCFQLETIDFADSEMSGWMGVGGAFRTRSNLSEIKVNPDNPHYRVVDNCLIGNNYLVLGCNTSVIPDDGSITAIESNAFSGSGVASVTIPSSVTSLGKAAFDMCKNLKKLVVPASVVVDRYNWGGLHIGAGTNGVSDAEIFFEVDELDLGSAVCGSAKVYWRGEWKYVNGVPTPTVEK